MPFSEAGLLLPRHRRRRLLLGRDVFAGEVDSIRIDAHSMFGQLNRDIADSIRARAPTCTWSRAPTPQNLCVCHVHFFLSTVLVGIRVIHSVIVEAT